MRCARTIAILSACLLSGCAPLATLPVMKPAEHDLTGIERIAIVNAAEEARHEVVASFIENRSYTLVEPAVLETVHPITDSDGGLDRAAALDAARQVGVDAVLECSAAAGGGLRAELIDVDSGEVLAAPAGLPAEGTAELVAALAPHYVPADVTLARQWWGAGKANVQAGNALARQGDWTAAEEAWEQARQADPGNHAALHNLALAAEARQDYREAFEYLDKALAQFPAKLYHQTRKAMEARQTAYLAAARQVEAIRAAASARASPLSHGEARPAADLSAPIQAGP